LDGELTTEDRLADKRKLEFFLLRYVPDAVKEEFVNIGVVMFEPGMNRHGFVDVRFRRDWRRVWCLDPQADVEMLQALERDVRRQIVDTHDREMLVRKLQDSFSNTIQVTAMKACEAEEPGAEIESLARLYFEGLKSTRPRKPSPREQILNAMQEEFLRAGVWKHLIHGIATSKYTRPDDGFRFDFGYRVGDTIKLFHAASLKRSADTAVALASRYPRFARGMLEEQQTNSLLTAVIDDDLDGSNEEIHIALGVLQQAQIRIAAVKKMPALAEVARQELLA